MDIPKDLLNKEFLSQFEGLSKILCKRKLQGLKL